MTDIQFVILPPPPRRDEQGRWNPDPTEREAMRHAAERDGHIKPTVRDDTWRGVFYRAAGVESRHWVGQDAINADLRARRDARSLPGVSARSNEA